LRQPRQEIALALDTIAVGVADTDGHFVGQRAQLRRAESRDDLRHVGLA
jgi:hypothetical protein